MSLLRTIQETIQPDQTPFDINESISNDLARLATERSSRLIMTFDLDVSKEEALALAFTEIMYECDEAIEKLYKSIRKPSKVKMSRFNTNVVTQK